MHNLKFNGFLVFYLSSLPIYFISSSLNKKEPVMVTVIQLLDKCMSEGPNLHGRLSGISNLHFIEG